MATLFRIDTETLPRVLVLDPPVTDAEFEALCRENDNVRLERTKEGAVRMNPPTGGWTGSGNQEIVAELERRQRHWPGFRFKHRLPASRRVDAKPGRFLRF